MIISILILIAGFALLIKSADILIEGSASLAKKLGVSAIVIGLTVVAFGTSAPELIINIVSSAQGASEIAIGNVLGSNIANILLILGIAAVICPLKVKQNTVWKEIPLSLLAVLVLAILANDILIDQAEASILSRIDGLILLAFFVIFLYYTFGIAKVQAEEVDVKSYKPWQMIIMISGGLIGLGIGGKLVVDNAVNLATIFGVSEALIGLTIVALGSSLPELVTAVVAVSKKHTDIAIGNVVGSNIFNIFWILGLSSVIKPLAFTPALNMDVLITLAITLILFAAIFIGEKNVLKKWEGITFLSLYIIYIAFLIFRG
jgi:cation:H+ antiporter